MSYQSFDWTPTSLREQDQVNPVDASGERLGTAGFLQDVALAPLRGIEGLAKSVWNLADWVTGDALADWDKRFLGESQTLVGGLIEGATQFAVGWGATGVALKAVKGVAGLSQVASATATAEKLTKLQRLGKFGQNVVKGGIVDFWAFEGDEGRLADLLGQYPAFAEAPVLGPTLEFLQSNEDDEEALGRFKNVLEGAGIGAGLDAFLTASKALRGVRKDPTTFASAADIADNALKKANGAQTVEVLEKTFRETAGELPQGKVTIAGKDYYVSPAEAADRVFEGTTNESEIVIRGYHGTPEGEVLTSATQLDVTRQGYKMGPGAYFSEDPSFAAGYAEGSTPGFLAAELRFKKPYEVFSGGAFEDQALRWVRENPEEYAKYAELYKNSDRVSEYNKKMFSQQPNTPIEQLVTPATAYNHKLYSEGYDAIITTSDRGVRQEIVALRSDSISDTGAPELQERVQSSLKNQAEVANQTDTAISLEESDLTPFIDDTEALNGSVQFIDEGRDTLNLIHLKVNDPVEGLEFESLLDITSQVPIKAINDNAVEVLKKQGYVEVDGFYFKPSLVEQAQLRAANRPLVQAPQRTTVNINGEPKTLSVKAAEQVQEVVDTGSLLGKLRVAGPEARQQVDSTIREYTDRIAQPIMSFLEKGGKTSKIPEMLEDFELAGIMDDIVTSDDLAYVANKISQNITEKLSGADPKELAMTFKEYYTGPVAKKLNDFVSNLGGAGRTSTDEVLKELEKGNAQMLQSLITQDAMRKIIVERGRKFIPLAQQAIEIKARGGDASEYIQELSGIIEQGIDGLRLIQDSGYLRAFGLAARKKSPMDFKVYNLKAIRNSQKAEDYFNGLKAQTKDEERLWDIITKAAKLDPTDDRALQRLFQGLEESNGARKYNTWKTWYKNNLLMNPATHIMNITNNIFRAHLGTFERYIGAKTSQAIQSVRGNTEAANLAKFQAEAASKEFLMFWNSIGDALHHAKTAWKNEGQGKFFDSYTNKLEGTNLNPEVDAIEEGIKTGRLNVKDHLQKWKDGTLDVIMPIHTIPGRMLGAVDEGMKIMTYNSVFKASAYAKGRAKGLSKEAALDFMEDAFQKSTIGGSRMVSEKGYAELARQAALEKVGAKYGGNIPADAMSEVEEIASDLFVKLNPKAQTAIERKRLQLLEDAGQVEKGTVQKYIDSEDYQEVDWLFSAAKAAERSALDNTFQQELGKKGFEKVLRSLQQVSQDDTLGGALMSTALPFIRTPYNVVKFSLKTLSSPITEGIPLIASERARTKLLNSIDNGLKSNDPRVQAEALEAVGRIGIGTSLAIAGFSLAQSGGITGTRPKDPAEAAVWDSLGIQEYSFKFGDTYVSYARLEPLATVLGVMADWSNMRNLTKDEEAGVFTAVTVSLASNVTEKTFLTSISTLLTAALSSDQQEMNRALNTVIAPIFANPGIAALNRAVTDDGTVREMRTLMDAVQGRTPGAADTVDPRRNVLGEVVKRGHPATTGIGSAFGMLNPMYLSERKSDKLMEEFLKLQQVPSPPSPRIGPLDLRNYPSSDGMTSAFDQRNALVSTLEIGGKTLRQSLEELIKSERYKRYAKMGPIEGELEDPRYVMIQQTIRRYRTRANIELRKVNPQVGELMQQAQILQGQINRGALSTVDANNILFQ